MPDDAARRQTEALRREQERAERARRRAAEAAEAEPAQAELERAVAEATKEAAQALYRYVSGKAALATEVAAQRVAHQAEKARLRAEVGGLAPERSDDLPPVLALLWGTTEPGRRGPRPGLTLDGIARAATELADADGLEAVSMARVATSLGVTTMALYRYVSSKDDLLALMTDTAIGDVDLPDRPAGVGWRPALEAWCRAQLDLARVHPWVMQLVPQVPALGPHRTRLLEAGLAALDGTPLTIGERTDIIGRLSLHVLSEGTLVAEIELQRRVAEQLAHLSPAAPGSTTGAPTTGPTAPEATHPALLDYTGLLGRLTDPESHPHITAALAAGVFDDDSAYDVDLGIRIVLDGVAALVDRVSAASDTVPAEEET